MLRIHAQGGAWCIQVMKITDNNIRGDGADMKFDGCSTGGFISLEQNGTEAMRITEQWDAIKMPSSVYFYKLINHHLLYQ
jgi:hypothetical protein